MVAHVQTQSDIAGGSLVTGRCGHHATAATGSGTGWRQLVAALHAWLDLLSLPGMRLNKGMNVPHRAGGARSCSCL